MANRNASTAGWIIIALIVLGVAQLGRGPDVSSSASLSIPAPRQVSSPAAAVPVQTPQATELRYVTATSLNVRREPSTSADIVSSLAAGTSVTVLDRHNGWLLVNISPSLQGWISEQYTASTRPTPRYSPPAQVSQPTRSASGLSCSPRRTCSQIASCTAAQWYRQNCSWGGRLDRDNDGLACETLC